MTGNRYERLVVVSNRLPVVLHRQNGAWQIKGGSGGLVSALGPVLRDRGGVWIGWPGTSETIGIREVRNILGPASESSGYRLFPVFLSPEEVESFYQGFSNGIIWPLFHDLQGKCEFLPDHWQAYLRVNELFASAVARHTTPRNLIWIHDYHLIHVAEMLSRQDVSRRCVFFLHIPFPPLDIFAKLPWRMSLLRALTAYDLVAFQTARDRRNFFTCLRAFFPTATVHGRGPVMTSTVEGRSFSAAAIPISIDYDDFDRTARSAPVKRQAALLREQYRVEKLALGVDRLDYTKGILERLMAFQSALERHPELRGRLSLVQVVVPSRETVKAYRDLKERIELLVSGINGKYTKDGWIPVVYLYQSMDRSQLVAHYLAADMALVTPLKDGMNLVCKEYCACHADRRGVLILSEFAGAAAQLSDTILINPYDTEGTAEAIWKAFEMSEKEQRRRMVSLRRRIQRQDVFWWVDTFLQAAAGVELDDFPEVELAPVLPLRRHEGP